MPKNNSAATAGSEDRISALPEELLNSILRRIQCPQKRAQTWTLSRQWRNLGCSYPVVEFNATIERLQTFVVAMMKKFSSENLLRMEALKVSVSMSDSFSYSYNLEVRSAMEQLLDLASKKKAEYVAIYVTHINGYSAFLHLPLESLSNSSARTLHLDKIILESKENDNDGVHLSLDSPLHLRLDFVGFEYTWLFARLMASCPLLETLEIRKLNGISKLNHPNLKTLKISDLDNDSSGMFREELIAPQLNTLEIADCKYLRLSDISRTVSKLQNLKSLTLTRVSNQERKLKLSCPKLEEFHLWAWQGLEDIELDVKSCFRKFFLHWRQFWLVKLKTCEIHNAAADCRWEVDFFVSGVYHISHQWFVEFKRFMMRFPQFQAMSLSVLGNAFISGADYDGEPPLSMEHLKIMFHEPWASIDDVLNGLFWACHPRFLTVGYKPSDSKRLLEFFLDLASYYSDKSLPKESEMKYEHRLGWLHQLKDMKIKPRETEQRVDIKAISKKMATLPAFEVCFELTW